MDRRYNGGMLRIIFGLDGCRKSVFASEELGAMLNMHPEMLNARLCNMDLPLQFTELEHLALLVDEICRAGEATVTRYLRGTTYDGTCLLHKTTKVTGIHKHSGGLELRFFPERVSEEEFEEARLRDAREGTATVRPLMSLCGDNRDTTALVRDAKVDIEALKIRNLVKSERGRSILQRLAQVSRQRLKAALSSQPPAISSAVEGTGLEDGGESRAVHYTHHVAGWEERGPAPEQRDQVDLVSHKESLVSLGKRLLDEFEQKIAGELDEYQEWESQSVPVPPCIPDLGD